MTCKESDSKEHVERAIGMIWKPTDGARKQMLKRTMVKTLENTTELGSINLRIPMRQHYKSRNPILQRRRIGEPVRCRYMVRDYYKL
jgi:hypothetical protein